jgi:hypothetical protein
MSALTRNSWGARAIAKIAAYGIYTITCTPLNCEKRQTL